MDIAKGRYPLSNNSAAAKNWIETDAETGAFVPRPDVSLTTMKYLSLLPFGFEHMYARSPMTGLVKCLTLGGGGLWWIWDICQLFCESDRVLNYGMSAPLDIVTGIGQGMITDKVSAYKADTPFSPWFISIIFSFMGLDALLSKQTAQFMRKFMEFLILLGCCIGIWKIVAEGITAAGIFGLFCLSVIGMLMFMIVGDEYINVLSIVFGGELFTTGLSFTKKAHAQYNGTLGIIDSLASIMIPPARKQQIIKDLQYGGVPAKELSKMFRILHTTEYAKQREDMSTTPAEEFSEGGAKKSPAILSFLILLISPILLIQTWVWHGIGLIYPPARYMEIAAEMGIPLGGFDLNELKKGVKSGDIVGKAGVKSYLQGAADKITHGEKPTFSDVPIKTGLGHAATQVSDILAGKFGQLGQGATKSLTETVVKSRDAVKGAIKQAGDAVSGLGQVSEKGPGLTGKFAAAIAAKAAQPPAPVQAGGAYKEEELSAEAQVFGAVTVALISGGAIKGLVDYLMQE